MLRSLSCISIKIRVDDISNEIRRVSNYVSKFGTVIDETNLMIINEEFYNLNGGMISEETPLDELDEILRKILKIETFIFDIKCKIEKQKLQK